MWNLSRAQLGGWIILASSGLLGCSIVTPAPLIELAKATGAAASTMISVAPSEPVNVVQNVAVSPKSVCIEYDPVCPVVDMLPALQQGLIKNGISSRVYEPGTHFGYCRYWMKYSASMDWDTPLLGDESQWPLVVSCGNQRRQSVVVVAPCGHVGKSQSGLSTCPCGLVVHELEAVS